MTYDNIIFVGDIHGDFKHMIRFIKEYEIKNSLFYVCGDFGVGFGTEREEYKKFKHFNISFKSKNNKVVSIRGNHDDPKYYSKNYKVSNIECLPDYTVIDVNGLNMLGIGGAISVDRLPNPDMRDNVTKKSWKGRKEGHDYWSDEIVNIDDDKLNSLRNIDIVVTHDATDFCYPENYSGLDKWKNSDLNIMNDCIENRKKLTYIYEKLKVNNNLKYWFYGHFHQYNFSEINGTRFILLDIDMCYPLDLRKCFVTENQI
jgi:UDP-2,3-diacylglucosamine pyrophosphatase LpxH